MKKLITVFLFVPMLCQAQQVAQTDWEHFWEMRDSVMANGDTARQRDLVNRLYIARASEGLKAFIPIT